MQPRDADSRIRDHALVEQAAAGDECALNQLLAKHEERIKRMIRLRLSRRLQGRVGESDVMQEAMLEMVKNLDRYLENPEAPFFLWFRQMAGWKLAEVHERHLGTQKRDALRDVSIYRGALPEANSISLAAQLLGQLTSPSEAAVKTEKRITLQRILDELDPADREIIALRHFEQLTTEESATVLGLSKSGAGSRYVRAIRRLRQKMSAQKDLFGT